MNTARAALLATTLALAAAGVASATDADKPSRLLPAQASIPFVNHGAIQDWQADKRQGVWIKDRSKQWYYAKLLGPCIGLDFALQIGFDTRAGDTLDRFGFIVVPDEDRCPIVSLSKSEAPPPARKRGKPTKPAAADAAVEAAGK